MNPFSTSRLRAQLALIALSGCVPFLAAIIVDPIVRQRWWLVGLAALVPLVAVLIGGYLFLLRPLGALRTVTARIAAGDLSAREQLADGVPGLSELGAAVNSIVVALEARQRERDQAQEELLAAEVRARQWFEGMPHPLWLYDPDTLAFLAVNQAAVDRYGYSREEFLRLTLNDLHPEEDVPEVQTRPVSGIVRYRGTWRHRTKDGRALNVDVSTNLVHWKGRHVRLALVEDITARKQLEAQLQQSQKMDAIGQLAGGIAHDFNNLLTAINGYAELLAATLTADDPRREDVNEIVRAGQQAAALTRQLLAFGHKQILRPRVLQLGDVVREITPMLGRLVGETIELELIMKDRGAVKADAGQLEQVLVNLVLNARDAMDDGGQLTIETADVMFHEEDARRPAFVPRGPYISVAVHDTGHGMDAATQSRIFEPFFTTKPKGKGTGLGLATVYGIVKQNAGYICVDSEAGRGSTFTVYLPRTDEPVPLAESRPAAEWDANGAETILLVEDEEPVRELVEKVLRRHGYSVHTMAHPARAIEFARAHRGRIHLLLTDVVLPEMSGSTLATQVREQHPEARVLYMSGYTEDAIVRNGVPQGSTWFLQKPFTVQTLVQKVREVLDAFVAPLSR